MTAAKATATNGTLSGTVYRDTNGNAAYDASEVPLAGIIITLHGTDSQGKALPSLTTTTLSDGSFSFTGLRAGTFSLTMDQPVKFNLGASTAGSLGGAAANNTITGIVVGADAQGTGYNFGIGSLVSSMISARLFLASTPPANELLAGIVSQYGISAPVVTSIVKADADPSTSNSLRFTVVFNESVTGVDTSDFAVIGSSTATVASVVGSGTTYTVTVSTNGATGSIGIELVDDDSIVRADATALGGSGANNGDFVGPSYSVTAGTTGVAISGVTDPINSSNQTNVTASGTGEVGAAISLVATDGTNSTTAYTTTVAADGTWSISGINVSSLADGTITFNVTATDTDQNTATDSKTATKDTVAPAVAVSNVTDPINANNASSTAASGTGEAGATISVVATDGTNSTTAVTTTIAADGTWSLAGIDASALNDGTITYNVTATDAAGNSASSSKTASKDTVAPAVAVTSVTDPVTIANHHDTEASGTGEVGATISVVATDGTNSTTAVTTTIAADGTWSLAGIDASALNDGTITYNVTATDAAGNSASSSKTASKDTVAPAVAVTSVTDPIGSSDQTNVTVSGTGEAGNSISLVASDGANTTIAYTTTIGADGTWTITDIDVSALADGTVTFDVTATDQSDNTAAASITAQKDTVAPAVSLTSVTDPINAANAAAVAASGTGDVGATVTLVATDGNNSTTEYTATVAEDGAWSIDGIDVSSLNEGTLTYSVTATDAAGNSNTASMTATMDLTAPAVEVTTILDPITIANHTATSVGGTGEVGATISVVASDGANSTTEYTTTVAGDGTWSIEGIDTTDLADGVLTYTATASDAAGNTATSSLTATKLTVAIAQITDPINAESAADVTVSGTGEVGATITLVVSDGANSTTEYTATVGQDATWSITSVDVSELADGTLTFTATATDENDNTAATSMTAEKDTVAPSVAVAAVTDPIDDGNETATAASGTGEVGASISLVASDGTHSTDAIATAVSEDGTWSIIDIDVSGLDDGTITFTVTGTDSFGNSSEASETATKTTGVGAMVDLVMGSEDNWT